MAIETTPWWGFLVIGLLVGFQWGFTGVSLLLQRNDWKKQKAEWRRLELLEAEHDAERAELAELFRAEHNREFRFARRITLGDLHYDDVYKRIGMEKWSGN